MHTSFLTPVNLLTAILISAAISGTAFAANFFQTGDEFVVARPVAPLMRGTRTLGWLPEGQRLTVLRTEGDWVGTKAVVGGRAIGGWLYRPHVLTPSRYAQQRTARRRFSYQAGEAGESDYVPEPPVLPRR